MGFWRRMRNKFKTRKATARPTRYMGHGGDHGDHGDHSPFNDRDSALPSPPRTPPLKALIESEERYSMSMWDHRPSMMSDRDGRHFEQMSFELPRR
ncbi:unnamed protein product [Discula destructiva]